MNDVVLHLTLLKVSPPFHGDLAAVELAFVFVAGLLDLLAGRLSRVTPAKVVELPVRVRWKDEIPYGQGNEVDQHPGDVGPAVRSQYNKHSW